MAFPMPAQRVAIHVFDEFEGAVARASLERAAEAALGAGGAGPASEVSVVIADDDVVRELNREHRGLDENTDVLSFSNEHSGEYYGEPKGDPLEVEFVTPETGTDSIGEVIISYPQTLRQAEEAGHPVEEELALLVVHGVLHLLGHDHEEAGERIAMESLQGRALSRIP